ncbi:MAG: KGG domain-containing protein [Acidobacteriota bacterium]
MEIENKQPEFLPIEEKEEMIEMVGEEKKKAGKERRGFASMDPEKQREIASKGGKAAHAKGTAHEFTSDEARLAGSKGGRIVSQNREHMAEIGRKGGQARGERHHGFMPS